MQEPVDARQRTGAFTLPTLDAVFTADRFDPTLATEVSFIGHGPMVVPGGTSDGDAWSLAMLSTQTRCLFEFGTCTGKTSYLWSRNAAPDAQIATH